MQTSVKAPESTSTNAMSPEHLMRGRTRDRSHTRSVPNTNNRTDKAEASTFRGRSRQRASSPYDATSRSASSCLLSPTRQILLYNRLHHPRREHCPSRAPSPVPRRRRRTRTRSRSRSRGPSRADKEALKMTEAYSGLRNEVHVDEVDAPKVEKAS